MSRKQFGIVVSIAAALGHGTSVFSAITIPTVPIGNPGNAADSATGFGSVAYTYSIGTTEVTNAQYASFLNAIATTDSNALFNSFTSSFIHRSGVSGAYVYTVVPATADHPVRWVSYWDACRFANWLHNGQPSGDQSNATTERGAYTLTIGGIQANSITRNAGALWAVASENEWYKAAYFQSATMGGDVDDYWLFPTTTNTITTAQANYGPSVGGTSSAGTYQANSNGAFDLGGNVWEWNETITFGPLRSVRGGGYLSPEGSLRANNWSESHAGTRTSDVGFRVTRLPGPSSAVLMALGAWAVGCRRRFT